MYDDFPPRRGRRLTRMLRRAAVASAGSSLVVAGVVLLVLPGPGTLVILAGLTLLATEFAWAARALDRVKTTVANRSIRRRRTPQEEPSREVSR